MCVGKAWWALAVVLTAASLWAAPSTGARTVVIGAAGEDKFGSTDARLAVDPAGVAHVVWYEPLPSGEDALRYCRLPRGAHACSPGLVLASGDALMEGASVVAPSPTAVHVLFPVSVDSPEENHLLRVSSGDGGRTFGAAVTLFAEPMNLTDAVAFTPYLGGFFIDSGWDVRLVGLNGEFPATVLPGEGFGHWQFAFPAGSDPVAVLVDDHPAADITKPDPPAPLQVWAAVDEPDAGWKLVQRRPPPGNQLDSATGPSAAWVTYGCDHGLRIAGVFGGRLTRSVRVPADCYTQSLAADPRGGIAVAYEGRDKVLARRSPTGRRWSRPRVLHRERALSLGDALLTRRGWWLLVTGGPANAPVIELVSARR